MNKDYARLKLIADCAQDLFDNRLGWSNGRNPYAPKEIWLKLEKAIYGIDKPDPHVVTQEPQPVEDDIVELLESWWLGGSEERRLRAFRAIQAGIQKNEQGIEAKFSQIQDEQFKQREKILDQGDKIEAVRKEPYTPALEARVSQLEVYFGRDIERIESLERKAEEVRNDFYAIQNIRKLNEEVKPQAKGGVARDMQIRPGSVCRDYDGETVVCLNTKISSLPFCVQISGEQSGHSCPIHHSQLTKLFDLPFPQDSQTGRLPGSSKGGEG